MTARCAACGATRRDVSIWRQVVALDPGAVCCWPRWGLATTHPRAYG